VAEDEVVPKRDMLVNFTDELFDSGIRCLPLKTLARCWSGAQYGIEFRYKHTIRQVMTLMQHCRYPRHTRRHFFICWSCWRPQTTISWCPAPQHATG
jgi:hypothetical protein